MVISNTPLSCRVILERFPDLFTDSIGSLEQTISEVSSPESASSKSLVFLATTKIWNQGFDSAAAALVISPKQKAEAETKRGAKTILIARNVELAMASVISEFFLRTPYTNRTVQGAHPSAVIDPTAQLADNVRIGPHAFVGANVKLAAGVYIGAGSVIEDQSEIGEDTVIHPQVFIGHSTQIGKKCEVHPQTVIGKEGFGYAHDERWNHYRIPHQGRVVLEDDVHIGACCTLDRGTFGETRIQAGTKFDNHVHIAHNCKIGRNSLVTAGFVMAGSSSIGANFVTGGKSVVTGHIEICDNVQLAALSAVSKGITKPGQYGGNPLQPLQRFVKTKVAMTHLPEMQKQIKQIMKKLDLETPESSSAKTDE